MKVSQRLQGLAPTINEILKVSGAAGASIGILHQNEVHTAGFGHRDLASGLEPEENTIYHIASLSKSFTAAAIGILVADKNLTWDQKVSDILPSFNHFDDQIQQESTILDFLSHRTGLASKNSLWQQDGPELLLEQKDTVAVTSYLEVVEPLRSKWLYNNWGYDLASEIIEKTSGMSWGLFLKERILAPLGLNNTYTSLEPPEENYARGYMAGADGQFTDVGRPVIGNGTVQQGSNGVKSTVSDLLTYYKHVLDAWKHESGPQSDSPSGSPLRNVKELLTKRIPLEPDSNLEQWYAAGWAVANLPAPVGSIGTNSMFVSEMPVVGKGSTDKTTVWYHNGSLVGFFSSVHVLPESGTIIVVLVNSIPKNDCADWLGQLLLEQILDNPDKNDYLALAKESAAAYDRMWLQLPKDLAKTKSPDVNPRPLEAYVGKYYNKPLNWFIEVIHTDGDTLRFSFQGRSTTQSHKLEIHGEDRFSWLLTEEESRHLGRWPDLDVSTYLFRFGTDETGYINHLRWVHDPDVLEGEIFLKGQSCPRTSCDSRQDSMRNSTLKGDV
jgi:CubicO group peptidase (beta-lactamase class C family)